MVKFLTLTCMLATLAVAMVMAQPPLGGVEAAEADCSTLIYDLMDCMEFLIVGGTETTPQKSCCSGFETVLATDANCICYALSNSGSLGLDVNMTRAQALAPSCGVSVDPIAACHVSSGSPVRSPANPPPLSTPPSNSSTPPPTMPPPAASPATGGAPVATPSGIAPSPRLSSIAGAPDSEAPAPAPKKSAAYAISATFSTLVLVISVMHFIA